MEQFFYSKGDEQFGPISATQLKQLAADGRLLPTDQVWQQGGGDKVSAAQCRGLVFNTASQASPVPPPLPPETRIPSPPSPSDHPLAAIAEGDSPAPSTAFRSAVSSFVGNAKAAGELIAKQAERTKLHTVSLPNAFSVLGKSLFTSGRYRESLKDAYTVVDGHLNAIKQLKSQAAAQPKAQNLTDKAKAAAHTASVAAQVKLLEAKARHALTELGELAIEKFGEEAGPPELIQPIVDGRSRLAALDEAIANLSESKTGQVVTPKRLAIGCMVALGVIAVLVVASFFGGGDGALKDAISGQWEFPPPEGLTAIAFDGEEVVVHSLKRAEGKRMKYRLDSANRTVIIYVPSREADKQLSLKLIDNDTMQLTSTTKPGKIGIARRVGDSIGVEEGGASAKSRINSGSDAVASSPKALPSYVPADKIVTGMTMMEVADIMGTPDKISETQSPDTATMQYRTVGFFFISRQGQLRLSRIVTLSDTIIPPSESGGAWRVD